jgi:hypothetical protein
MHSASIVLRIYRNRKKGLPVSAGLLFLVIAIERS